MQHANKNTTRDLARFCNDQRVNEACNGSLITRGYQEHGVKIIYPLHVTGFDALQDYDSKETDISGEEMICKTLYLESSDKARVSDLNKSVKNDYVLNKSE